MLRSRRLVPVLFLVSLLSAPAFAVPGISLVWSATTGTGTPGGAVIDARLNDILTLDVVVTPDANGMQQMSVSLAFDPAVLQALAAEECPAPPNLLAELCSDAGLNLASPLTVGVGNPAPTSSVGDFDGDGTVGSSDFALFFAEFGLFVPPGNPLFDINMDGVISAPDFVAAFPNQFGFPGSPGIVPGGVEIIEVATINPPLGTSFTLGRIQLRVVGGGAGSPVDLVFLPDVDGYVDGTVALVADSTNPGGATLTNASVTVTPPAVPLMALGLFPLLGAALLGVARGAVRR